MKRLIVFIAAILIFVSVVFTSVQVSVLNDSFFKSQYIKNDVALNTGIKLPELMRITDEIQAYLFGKRADFHIDGTVNGNYQPVFNEREILHMVDVLDLFQKGLLIRNAASLMAVMLLLFLWSRERILAFRAMQFSVIVTFGIVIISFVMLMTDFNRYFVLFHEVLFSNDLWILDPQTSILVNMVPLPFFMAIANRILLTSAAALIVVAAAGMWGAQRLPVKQPNHLKQPH